MTVTEHEIQLATERAIREAFRAWQIWSNLDREVSAQFSEQMRKLDRALRLLQAIRERRDAESLHRRTRAADSGC